MYLSIKEIHNIIGMVLLFILLIIIIIIGSRYILKYPFDKSTQMLTSIGLIIAHSQIVVGIILYFLSPSKIHNFSGESIEQSSYSFYTMEHPLAMILAAVLVTFGYRAARREELSSQGQYRRVLTCFGGGLGIMIYMTPWFMW